MKHVKFPEDGEESKIVVKPGDIVDINHTVDVYDSLTGELIRTVKYKGRVYFDAVDGEDISIRIFGMREG